MTCGCVGFSYWCADKFPHGDLICSLAFGHRGLHVACSGFPGHEPGAHNHAWWPDPETVELLAELVRESRATGERWRRSLPR